MYAVEEKLKELKKLDEEQEALNPYSVGSIKYDLVKFKGARQTLIDGLDVALRELGESMTSNIPGANGKRRDPAPRGPV
jgi:hypothetical protein